jgi:hypothetical protein
MTKSWLIFPMTNVSTNIISMVIVPGTIAFKQHTFSHTFVFLILMIVISLKGLELLFLNNYIVDLFFLNITYEVIFVSF